MAHAIGQEHEQSRDDRDNYVTMLWSNIDGGENNRNMKKTNTYDNNPYDYESVLQYSLTVRLCVSFFSFIQIFRLYRILHYLLSVFRSTLSLWSSVTNGTCTFNLCTMNFFLKYLFYHEYFVNTYIK